MAVDPIVDLEVLGDFLRTDIAAVGWVAHRSRAEEVVHCRDIADLGKAGLDLRLDRATKSVNQRMLWPWLCPSRTVC